MMAEQLVFDLPVNTAFGRDDFFSSPANHAGIFAIEDWRNWPRAKLVLVGPIGSGKSHLARIWADLSGATIVEASDLCEQDLEQLATGPVCVENVSEMVGQGGFDEALFHLHNMLAESGQTLLITGHGVPIAWPFSLPDLASRVQGTQLVQLQAPDDMLLLALLLKLSADRQLQLEPGVVDFVLRRVERSFAGVHKLVAELDRISLQRKRPIGQRMAAETLRRLEECA